MATFNGERFVGEQLKSILSQLSKDDEIVVSDDASTDKTLDIIHSFHDSRIKVLAHQDFQNPIYNFENALKNSTGDIIFLSDQDDIWKPQKISVMSPLILKHGLALCDCSLINETGDLLHPSYFSLIKSKPGLPRNLYKTNPYIGCCMGFSRKLLETALPFPKNIPMHDLWIGFMGELFFNPIFVPQKLVSYRRHQANVSPTGLRSNNSFFYKIGFRINTILPAIWRTVKIKRRLWRV
jgi:glycosyltransferase involved in cell wall biosynthesis